MTTITDSRLAEIVGAGVPCVPIKTWEVAHVVQELRAFRLSALSPRVSEIAERVLDAAGNYMYQQYGNSALHHPTDRARIMSAIEVSASPRVVTDEKRAEVREKFAGIHKSLDHITAALSQATGGEG